MVKPWLRHNLNQISVDIERISRDAVDNLPVISQLGKNTDPILTKMPGHHPNLLRAKFHYSSLPPTSNMNSPAVPDCALQWHWETWLDRHRQSFNNKHPAYDQAHKDTAERYCAERLATMAAQYPGSFPGLDASQPPSYL
ncbi:hypothetical protein [Yaravirus sp. 'brasiliensis']|uniref:Uncharacterized protein n=1 Tax=Yaravirus sp. 'brasiliensis' TaxID=2739681 RepID=A0AAE7E254_9VIRU|nr:hypothetical protein QKS73_gp40 [Yaravirus brasiliensis]QKE44437.1 hypothetical protein [Yaravirus brasiliensis]